ncbi:MAG: hypothetical protein V3S43_06440 [Acidimicrobiia bacterium]
MLLDPTRAPTSDECTHNVEVDGMFGAWYPQVGGYGGKCWIRFDSSETCFDVFLWHDGEFPLGDGDNPRELHHCMADQFVDFGKLVLKLKRDK